MPQPHLSLPRYRPDIDGLRAVAVLPVVGFHAFPGWVKGGFIGVDVFFVISGFLISTIIFENLDRGTFSFSEFYARRIRRILPALLLVLTACFTFGWFGLLTGEYRQLGKHIAAGAGFVPNFVLWNEAGYFDNAADTKPLLHLWSLGIEEQFYIVWPLLLWAAWKLKLNLLAITLVAAFASFVLNVTGIGQDAVAVFYSPQTRFWELLSGSLLAWVTLYRREALAAAIHRLDGHLAPIFCEARAVADGKAIANAVSVVGSALLAYGFWTINRGSGFPGAWALIPVLGAILIISAGSGAWINRTILSNRIAVWFGLISYPLYLWHWPFFSFARIIEGETASPGFRIAAIGLSIVLAWVTYRLVERPIRFGRHGYTKAVALVALLAAVGSVGYGTHMNDGLDSRPIARNFADARGELVRTPAVNDECLDYIGNRAPLFPYCRFTNASARETVAVIGDSHAHVAYTGIAEYLKENGTNAVLLANSACPPFLGVTTGNNPAERDACRATIEQLIDTVSRLSDVHKVLIFARGPYYLTGTEPISGEMHLSDGQKIPVHDFGVAAQRTIHALAEKGKTVIFVTENPELPFSPESCLGRPFESRPRDCYVDKSSVLARHDEYLRMARSLKSVTLVDSFDAFCPESRCLVLDEQRTLLYADDDHLSKAGSRFQVRKQLKDYLP